jgi:hypothetical protein
METESHLDIDMQTNLQELQKQVLELPIHDRWQSIKTLLESLQRETQPTSSNVSQSSDAVMSYEEIPEFPATKSSSDLDPWTQSLIGVIQLDAEKQWRSRQVWKSS